MSYGLNCKCNVCTKKNRCVDMTFIQAAISGVHMVNWQHGVDRQMHLGAGTIEIQCCNFNDERTPVEPYQDFPGM